MFSSSLFAFFSFPFFLFSFLLFFERKRRMAKIQGLFQLPIMQDYQPIRANHWGAPTSIFPQSKITCNIALLIWHRVGLIILGHGLSRHWWIKWQGKRLKEGGKQVIITLSGFFAHMAYKTNECVNHINTLHMPKVISKRVTPSSSDTHARGLNTHERMVKTIWSEWLLQDQKSHWAFYQN